jgi:hypothetical protein
VHVAGMGEMCIKDVGGGTQGKETACGT